MPEYDSRNAVWWILGPNGEFLARSSFPERFRVHQISDDEVLGVWLDELDVNYVERRSVIRD